MTYSYSRTFLSLLLGAHRSSYTFPSVAVAPEIMSVIARRGLFRKATKTVRPNRPPRSTGKRALLQILLGHDTQRGGGGRGSKEVGERKEEKRRETSRGIANIPIRLRESTFPFDHCKKGVRVGGGRGRRLAARACRRSTGSLARSPTFECCSVPQRALSLHLEGISQFRILFISDAK